MTAAETIIETTYPAMTAEAWREVDRLGGCSQRCTRCGREERLGSYCTMCGSAEYDLIVHTEGMGNACPLDDRGTTLRPPSAARKPGRVLGVVHHPGRSQAVSTARAAS